jgi:hypothetical protein
MAGLAGSIAVGRSERVLRPAHRAPAAGDRVSEPIQEARGYLLKSADEETIRRSIETRSLARRTWINDCYTADVVNGVGEYAGAFYGRSSASERLYDRSCSMRHSRGSLSSRQRWNFAPWRMRCPVMWSNATSTTSSGRSPSHTSSSSDFQREASPEPRS